MPLLRNVATGELELVADVQAQAAIARGTHALIEGQPLQVRALKGQGGVTSPEQLQALGAAGAEVTAVPEGAVRRQESAAYEADRFSGPGEALAAGITGALDAATLGGFSAVNRVANDDTLARSVRQHEGAYLGGQIVGGLATGRPGAIGPAGAAARMGQKIASGGKAGVARAAAGYGAEGAIQGLGAGIGSLANAEDPLEVERALSTLSSNAFLGGTAGLLIGAFGKAAEKGLARTKRAVDEAKAARMTPAAGEVTDDLVGMDARALRAADEAEDIRIEADRVPLRAQLAQDIAAARAQAKIDKPWIAVEGFKEKPRRGAKAPKGKPEEVAFEPADQTKDPFAFLPATRESVDEAWRPISAGLSSAERRAADIYSTTDHTQIQGYLRGEKARTKFQKQEKLWHPDKELDTSHHAGGMKLREVVKNLDAAIAKSAAPQDLLVYRGAQGAHLPDQLNPGDVVRMPGYQSLSIDPKVADNFSAGGAVIGGVQTVPNRTLFEVELPAGSKALNVSQVAGGAEGELLLPRGQAMEVIHARMVDGRRVVRVRVLQPKGGAQAADPAAEAAQKAAAFEAAREFREIGKTTLKADRQLDNLLDNPKRLAEKPWLAEAALQQQEHALERLQAIAPELRRRMALDPGSSGARERALATVDAALERNRSLQARLKELVAPPSSPRKLAIQAARDQLVTGRQGMSTMQQAGGAYAAAALTGLAPGGPLAAAGAVVASKAARWVFGRLGKSAAKSAERTSRAVDNLLSATRKVTPAAARTTAKTLSLISFSLDPEKASTRPKGLEAAYAARTKELLELVERGPDGKLAMRMEARKKIAERLDGVAAVDPILADKAETHIAKRILYAAEQIPREPDMGGMQIGPSRWKPSERDMRRWARIAAAVEDPAAVEERLAAGILMPDEAEAYREVYPEKFMDLRRQVVERLPELRRSLPRDRRLALSIFLGVPVDPSLSPPILRVMQGMYVDEPGTEGGTQAPVPTPQSGSISREQPTPSQSREMRP